MPTADDPRITVRLPRELFDRLPSGRGRSVFVRGALEAALGGQGDGDTPSVSSPRGSISVKETAPTESPVSPRAPERTCPLTPQQLVGRSNGGLTLARATELVERGGWEAYVA